MNNDIKLSDFIATLRQGLSEQSAGSPRGPGLESAEVEVQLIANTNSNGEIELSLANSENESSSGPSNSLKIRFSLTPKPASADNNLNTEQTNDGLALIDNADDAFEGFKKRFQESVERHGGVPPNKKKSVFD